MKNKFFSALLIMTTLSSYAGAKGLSLVCYQATSLDSQVLKSTTYNEQKETAELSFDLVFSGYELSPATTVDQTTFNVAVSRETENKNYKYEITKIATHEPTKQRVLKVENYNDPVPVFDSGVACQITD
jgi:hypothetical protein